MLTGKEVCASLHAHGAEVVARYVDGRFQGAPAITVKRHGRGEAWYVGSRLDLESLRVLARDFTRRLELTKPFPPRFPWA